MNESTWSSWQEGAGEPRWVGGGVGSREGLLEKLQVNLGGSGCQIR